MTKVLLPRRPRAAPRIPPRCSGNFASPNHIVSNAANSAEPTFDGPCARVFLVSMEPLHHPVHLPVTLVDEHERVPPPALFSIGRLQARRARAVDSTPPRAPSGQVGCQASLTVAVSAPLRPSPVTFRDVADLDFRGTLLTADCLHRGGETTRSADTDVLQAGVDHQSASRLTPTVHGCLVAALQG